MVASYITFILSSLVCSDSLLGNLADLCMLTLVLADHEYPQQWIRSLPQTAECFLYIFHSDEARELLLYWLMINQCILSFLLYWAT